MNDREKKLQLEADKRKQARNQESASTINAAMSQLKANGKVLIVRPTGFGKTYLLVDIIKKYAELYPDKKVLYIYPNNVIKDSILGDKNYMEGGIIKKNVVWTSYIDITNKIRGNKTGKPDPEYWVREIEKKNIFLICVDEAHCGGAEGFTEFMESIRFMLDTGKVHMLGVTATPKRLDDTEDTTISKAIFDNIQVYPLSFGDCIRKGIMLKLNYTTRFYDKSDVIKVMSEYARKHENNKSHFEESFNMKVNQIIKDYPQLENTIIDKMGEVNWDLSVKGERYHKFIVFMTDIADMVNRGPEVESRFDLAFNKVAHTKFGKTGKFELRYHYFASSNGTEAKEKGRCNATLIELAEQGKNRKYYDDTAKISNLTAKEGVIDVFFTVNMFNMGYHVDDVTGVLLMRGTKSPTLYTQQIGRCISVSARRQPIIIDLVSNYEEYFDKEMKGNNYNGALKDIKKELLKDNTNSRKPLEDDTVDEADETINTEYMSHDINQDIVSFLDEYNSGKKAIQDYIEYLYIERELPICAIAADLHIGCLEVANHIMKATGDVPRDETAQFRDYMYREEEKHVSRSKIARNGKYFYSEYAHVVYVEDWLRGSSKGKTHKTLWSAFN